MSHAQRVIIVSDAGLCLSGTGQGDLRPAGSDRGRGGERGTTRRVYSAQSDACSWLTEQLAEVDYVDPDRITSLARAHASLNTAAVDFVACPTGFEPVTPRSVVLTDEENSLP